MKINSLVCSAAVVAALFASAHCARAFDVNVELTGDSNIRSESGPGYWNVIEFSGGGYPSISDALDSNANSTGIAVAPVGEEYDGRDGYCDESGGGTITFQVDLPAGTFDVSATPGPGDIYGPAADVDVNGGNSTGIVGPTTIYVSFLNQGSAITRAAEIYITGTAPADVNVELTSDTSPRSESGAGYWNVIGFSGGGYPSISDALDTDFNSTGISVAPINEEYDARDGYCDESGGGTITFEIDLPAGNYDITATPGPGDIYGPAAAVDINGGNSTGIVGPTTVYVSFVNQGSAITRAAEIYIHRN